MAVRGLLAAVVCTLALPALAGKLYKIVDENGNVTFSQFPPKEKTVNTQVEGIDVKTGGKAPLREVGNRIYCGDMLVSYRRTGSTNVQRKAQALREDTNYWRDKLRRLERNANERAQEKLSSGGGYSISRTAERNNRYLQQQQEDAKEMRELRCAIDWAESQQRNELVNVKQSGDEQDRLRAVKAQLEARMVDQCGREPLLDPTDPSNALNRRQWRACSKDFRKDIAQVERELRRR